MKQFLIALLALFASTLAGANGYPLSVQTVQDSDGIWSVIAHNAGSAPVYISVALKNKINVKLGGMSTGGQTKALEPGAKETLIVAVADVPNEKMSFEYETKWVFGRGSPRGDHVGLYRPPFPGDLTFETVNDVTEPTRTERTRNSISILMPEGTPVIAARSGYVMDEAGRPDDITVGSVPYYESIGKLGKYVRIIHDDGTWAEYRNLQDGSVTVVAGQHVEAGTQIAKSGGAAGLARPSMQFAVLKPNGGLSEPSSMSLKMEMAGRGVMHVVAGETMGASHSVLSDASTTIRDPLVVANVKYGENDNKAGVYSAGIQPGSSAENALFVGIGVGMTIVGGFAIWLIQKRKVVGSWKHVFEFAMRKKKNDKTAEWAVHAQERSELGGAIDLRPKPGYLVGEWDETFFQSVSLGMPIGYVAHPKVCLNRLFARPLSAREDAAGLAVLRGESLDVVIVRSRDNKIVTAIDIKRPYALIDGQAFAAKAKREMLYSAGIPYAELDKETGPSEIRELLTHYAKGDFAYGLVADMRKAA
jgi:murein DD-endopeptidase MepM/ murein hydrolase activator NlpD